MRTARTLLCVFACSLAAHCGGDRGLGATAAPELEVRGAVASVQSATAIAAVDGRIASIAVAEGASVKAGDVVATLANPVVERDLAFARAQRAVAERRLDDARRPGRASSGDSERRVRLAASILANLEARRDRYRDLYATRDVSKQELEDVENAHAAAQRDWLAERERASAVSAGIDPAILHLELEKARADEAFAAERRSLLAVKAPIGGVVTRVAARTGENVFPRDPIVEIADASTVEVRGEVAPELLRFVQPGTTVDVKIFTVPPRHFRVPIRSIIPGERAAVLIVQLPNPDRMLQSGQQAVIVVK